MQAAAQDSTKAIELFGVHFMGLNAANGHKLLLTVGAVVVVWLLGLALRALLRLVLPRGEGVRVRFWPE